VLLQEIIAYAFFLWSSQAFALQRETSPFSREGANRVRSADIRTETRLPAVLGEA